MAEPLLAAPLPEAISLATSRPLNTYRLPTDVPTTTSPDSGTKATDKKVSTLKDLNTALRDVSLEVSGCSVHRSTHLMPHVTKCVTPSLSLPAPCREA
jgi:hypothetical protein